MTPHRAPLDIPPYLERFDAPRQRVRPAIVALIVAVLIALLVLDVNAAERPRPEPRSYNLGTACPDYNLAKGDALVFRIESRADGKPGITYCSVIKRPPAFRDRDERKKRMRLEVIS